MKECYYYLRDHKRIPRVTICLLFDGEYVARGMALCSYDDIPCKATGRRIAKGRALKALGTKWTTDEVGSRGISVLSSVQIPEKNDMVVCSQFYVKSYFEPALTKHEEKMLGLVTQ